MSEHLIAHWQFNKSEGKRIKDHRGGYDGDAKTVNGTIQTPSYTNEGFPQSAIRFFGSNFIEMKETADLLKNRGRWAISFFFKQEEQFTDVSESILRTMISAGSGNDGICISIEVDKTTKLGDRLQFRIGPRTETVEIGFDDKWHHVVFARERSIARIYIDDTLRRTFGDLPNRKAEEIKLQDIRIGRDGSSRVVRFFKGFIDDVRLYDSADDLSNRKYRSLYQFGYGLYEKGKENYDCYRIPSLIVAPNGDLLAICEGRKNSCSDTGDIDILMKRSKDKGFTWSKHQIIIGKDNIDFRGLKISKKSTWGNPCPVVEKVTNTIWLFMCSNHGDDTQQEITEGDSKEPSRRLWAMKSSNNGHDWDGPLNIGLDHLNWDDSNSPLWRWFATGPGIGIQHSSGRLIIPCNFGRTAPVDRKRKVDRAESFVIFKDKGQDTWQKGGKSRNRPSESEVVELTNGDLLMSTRSDDTQQFSVSNDQGESWFDSYTALTTPACQTSIVRYSQIGSALSGSKPFDSDKNRLLFSGPTHPTKRRFLKVKVSYDEGRTWNAGKRLEEINVDDDYHQGYSCLTVLPDMTICCLYEWGFKVRKLIFMRFTLEWLSNNQDKHDPPTPNIGADTFFGSSTTSVFE